MEPTRRVKYNSISSRHSGALRNDKQSSGNTSYEEQNILKTYIGSALQIIGAALTVFAIAQVETVFALGLAGLYCLAFGVALEKRTS